VTCPNELDLARSISVGASPAVASHVAGCASCRDAWDRTLTMIELARELPVVVPPHVHREEARTALLARHDAAPKASAPIARRIAIAGGALAAAAVVAIIVMRPAPAPTAHGSVRPRGLARYELAAPRPDEIVRLHDGTIDVDVDPLDTGERFRVVVGANEVEVHGTSFEVTATADQLVGVTVTRGRVEVRPSDGAPAVLGAGESWHTTARASMPTPTPAPTPSPDPTPTPTPTPSPTPTPPPTPTPSPTPRPSPNAAAIRTHVEPVVETPSPAPVEHPRAPDELAYDDAWAAMRASKFHQSAAAFARTIALAPDGALADDARYWHAVSLAREPRVVEAIAAFRELLDEHPGGTQRGEASVMLGWLLVDTHEPTEAATRFRAATSDKSAAVRDSAAAGLRALHAAP
jgi:TolA-binding protein